MVKRNHRFGGERAKGGMKGLDRSLIQVHKSHYFSLGFGEGDRTAQLLDSSKGFGGNRVQAQPTYSGMTEESYKRYSLISHLHMKSTPVLTKCIWLSIDKSSLLKYSHSFWQIGSVIICILGNWRETRSKGRSQSSTATRGNTQVFCTIFKLL